MKSLIFTTVCSLMEKEKESSVEFEEIPSCVMFPCTDTLVLRTSGCQLTRTWWEPSDSNFYRLNCFSLHISSIHNWIALCPSLLLGLIAYLVTLNFVIVQSFKSAQQDATFFFIILVISLVLCEVIKQGNRKL